MKKNKKIILSGVAILSLFTLPVNANEYNKIATEINSDKLQNPFFEGVYSIEFQKTKKGEQPLVKLPDVANRGKIVAPFGKHSTGQSMKKIANKLNLKGEVFAILDNTNTILVKMDKNEVRRLSKDKRILRISPIAKTRDFVVQDDPGWGLDRIDEVSSVLNTEYDYTSTGVGRTIWVLDTGLDLNNTNVANEFDGRASVFWDVNGGNGADCVGHGTKVSMAAAGETYGVAKEAILVMVKLSNDCTSERDPGIDIMAFNWIATNLPAGTIVNYSRGLHRGGNCTAAFDTALENSIIAAHNAGIIVVVAAGNDGCNTDDFSPANIPEAFVVGATSDIGIPGQDRKSSFSRTGTNISSFAPGEDLLLMHFDGTEVDDQDGTSFSAPYVAGIFAVACQASGTLCDTTPVATLYETLRNTGTLNTVTDTDGTPLSGATSRFIAQQW